MQHSIVILRSLFARETIQQRSQKIFKNEQFEYKENEKKSKREKNKSAKDAYVFNDEWREIIHECVCPMAS